MERHDIHELQPMESNDAIEGGSMDENGGLCYENKRIEEIGEAYARKNQ